MNPRDPDFDSPFDEMMDGDQLPAPDEVSRGGRGESSRRSGKSFNPVPGEMSGDFGGDPATRDFSPKTAGYRNYRNYRDYRSTDYRGTEAFAGESEPQIDWMAALWRYRYAMILPIILGVACGGAYFTTQPNVYRSTARLVVESTKPWIPDASQVAPVSSVPSSELLLMQLRSEQVLEHVASHPLLAEKAAQLTPGGLRGGLSGGVQFQNAMQKGSAGAEVFLLYFDSEDPQFAVNAVTALSDGLQHYFAERSETSVSELKRLITTAKDKLLPELNSLESEYREFRENSELSWDKSGEMINPYREKQLALQARRLTLEDDMRDLSTKMMAIQNTIQSTKDPLLVMEVVQQLLGEELFAVRQLLDTEASPATASPAISNRDEDLSLAKLTIERTLLPLEVERQQFASAFGTGHPSVRQLDQQIIATREKLNEVTAQENQRLQELRQQQETPAVDLVAIRRERAELAVSGFMKALETRKAVLESQTELLDTQITKLSGQAANLARAESENAMYLRRIDRAQKLFDSVEEQMTRISLADQDASIHVSQLNAPSAAGLVSPILSKFLLTGGMIGTMLGLGLVYLLESQSKTFRSSDEVASTLGVRVLSHVPTDSHKLPKVPRGETYPFADIDPSLSSIHRPRSATSEAIRRLRTSVFFDANTIGAKVIQVTSPLPEDGKSTLAANLAISIARSGKTVVIVDADMRRPQMTSSFSMEQKHGLTELIDGACDPSQVIHATAIENLWIVPCGPIPTNPAEALSMQQFNDFLAWLRDRYDFVIVDTPPLLIVTDPSIVASAVEGIVFTFRIRRGSKPQAKEAIAMLRATGTPIFGCVINRVDHTTTATGYQSYHSSSYYGRRYQGIAPSTTTKTGKNGAAAEYVVIPRATKTIGEEFATTGNRSRT